MGGGLWHAAYVSVERIGTEGAAETFRPILDHPSPLLYDPLMSVDGAEDLATMDTLPLGDTEMHIFVGNLAFTTTEQDLCQLLAPYGTVDTIRIMTDRDTGRSRGFGCVEMPDRHADQDAMAGLHGTPRPGRTLTVNAARPRAPRPLRW